MPREHVRRDVQKVDLRLVAVADHAAEEVVRTARTRGDAGAEQPTRAGLGHREPHAARAQGAGHEVVHGAAVGRVHGHRGLQRSHERVGLRLGLLAAPVADAHGHLSPADVDAELDEVVRQRVDDGADLQLADAEDADRAHGDVGKDAVPLERRRRLLPHLLKFVGDAGIGEDARAPRSRRDARRDAGRRHGSGAGRQQRLTPGQVERLAVVEAPARGDGADALLDEGERVGILLERDAEDLREALGGEVVVRGAQPPTDHQQVGGADQRVPQGGDEPLAVVGDREQLRHLDAAAAEVVADEGAVGVAGAAVEQLVAAEDHRRARRPRGHQPLVPGMRMRPRAFLK